jgi:hypothetical protein
MGHPDCGDQRRFEERSAGVGMSHDGSSTGLGSIESGEQRVNDWRHASWVRYLQLRRR